MWKWLLVVLLAGCSVPPPSPSAEQTPLPSGWIRVGSHCGLDDAIVEIDGELWRFDAPESDGPPAGWSDFQDVEVREGPSGPVVVGPDGREWKLILLQPGATPLGLCI